MRNTPSHNVRKGKQVACRFREPLGLFLFDSHHRTPAHMRLNAQERRIMGTKMGIAVGFGIGYVLGTRAGREQYARICACAGKLRRFPLVARPLDAAGEKMSALVRVQGEKVTDKVADAVKERLFRMPAAEPEITEEDLPTYAG